METEVKRILWRDDIQIYEDNVGNFYNDIEDVIKRNQEYFSIRDSDFLTFYWTTVQQPRRINLNDDLTWEISY